MTALRYVDFVLLWLTVPLAIALGAPELGILIGAVTWTVQRGIALVVDRKARERETVREAIGLNMATMMARMWLVGTAVVVAGVGGQREDGVAAAAVLIGAFTISFVATIVARSLRRADARPRTPSHA